MIQIVELIESPLENKKYRAITNDGKHYDFGVKDIHNTYIDHRDKSRRERYWIRHYNSKREQPYIKNLIPSPSLFSYYILWGNSHSIKKNIKELNKLFLGE